jgi:hypothetical protein
MYIPTIYIHTYEYMCRYHVRACAQLIWFRSGRKLACIHTYIHMQVSCAYLSSTTASYIHTCSHTRKHTRAGIMCVPELDNRMRIWYIHTYNTYPHTHTRAGIMCVPALNLYGSVLEGSLHAYTHTYICRYHVRI